MYFTLKRVQHFFKNAKTPRYTKVAIGRLNINQRLMLDLEWPGLIPIPTPAGVLLSGYGSLGFHGLEPESIHPPSGGVTRVGGCTILGGCGPGGLE